MIAVAKEALRVNVRLGAALHNDRVAIDNGIREHAAGDVGSHQLIPCMHT